MLWNLLKSCVSRSKYVDEKPAPAKEITLREDYEYGCGFKIGEYVTLRDGATVDVRGAKMPFLVIHQSKMWPWKYHLAGERQNPRPNEDRFVVLEYTSGHDWKRWRDA